jgi:hypothetical protein
MSGAVQWVIAVLGSVAYGIVHDGECAAAAPDWPRG